ncbi:HTH-type transcriptional regulator protein [Rhizobium phage RHEph12]|nr:HTH-type transcriptional regulator protein [Rhizobium phage RHEph12]
MTATRSKLVMRHKSVDKAIGARLRSVRRRNNKTLIEASELLDISYQMMQKYENGTNRIAVSTLIEYCKKMDADPREFLDEHLLND